MVGSFLRGLVHQEGKLRGSLTCVVGTDPAPAPSTILSPSSYFQIAPGKPLAGNRRQCREAPTQQRQESLGQDTRHFLTVGSDLRRAQRGRHSNSSSTVCPFPALAANFNHFLHGPPPASAAAWPHTDPGRHRMGLVLPARSLEPAVPSSEHPAKRLLDAGRGTEPEC